MKTRRLFTIAALLPLLGLLSQPAAAQHDHDRLVSVLSSLADSLEAAQDDSVIRQAFREELDRDPTDSELRRYRVQVHEHYWTGDDIRDDLRERTDYRRHSSHRFEDPDRVIRRAYQDVLHREPDAEGLRTYQRRMIDDDWSEHDVREALKQSPEHEGREREYADKLIKRAYRDILDREPDYNGLAMYRSKVLHQGWSEHDVRRALEQSPEYRQKNNLTPQQAQEIVRRAYREVLGREPDSGSRGYVQRVLEDHWTAQDVARELRHSDEYRNKHR